VGGVTAANIDFAHVLTDKLPIFIAIVVFPPRADLLRAVRPVDGLRDVPDQPDPIVRGEKTTGEPEKDNVSA
jgi:hypothetical protein